MAHSLDVEYAVNDRYSLAAHQREEQLCCPIEYDLKFLDVIPREIKDKDYGCGDPTPFVRQADVVLDLGSGGGKICYIAAQIVGPG
jgi:arsenite methyltransferase